MRLLNSLHDVKLAHNAVIMMEEKSADEMASESNGPSVDKDVELLDDTESVRTVIANVSGFEDFQRF